jgi:predicted SAM-dependent methyltransferase
MQSRQQKNIMIKIDIGCGSEGRKDWINVDAGNYKNITSTDPYLNEYPNEYADEIYSSLLLGYFSLPDAKILLQCWWETLKPAGKLELVTHNFKRMVQLYVEKNRPVEDISELMFGRMNMNNEFIYHRSVYDYNSLRKLLVSAGFTDVIELDTPPPHVKLRVSCIKNG